MHDVGDVISAELNTR